MNNPNIAFVKSLYVAFERCRVQTIVDAVAPNVDWQTVGRSKDYPAFGPRKGRAAVEEFFASSPRTRCFPSSPRASSFRLRPRVRVRPLRRDHQEDRAPVRDRMGARVDDPRR
jgi:hypothetical protein